MVAGAVGGLVACGGEGESGGTHPGASSRSPHPSTPYEAPIFADLGTKAPPDGTTPTSRPDDVYRDYAAFSYQDRGGRQVLSQWLINDDGTAYWSRYCRIADKGGPDWTLCSAWGGSRSLADLGLPEFFGPIAGMGTFVFVTPAKVQEQWIAQTVFSENGTVRLGRVCPIEDDRPGWSGCTDWSKLEVYSANFGIADARTFRDDSMYTYQDPSGRYVLGQALLSADGTSRWTRACPSAGGNPFVDVKSCSFGGRVSIGEFGIRVSAIAGHGSYIYRDAGKQVYAETVVSMDGKRASSHTCPVTPTRGVDWYNCNDWSTQSLVKLRTAITPL